MAQSSRPINDILKVQVLPRLRWCVAQLAQQLPCMQSGRKLIQGSTPFTSARLWSCSSEAEQPPYKGQVDGS